MEKFVIENNISKEYQPYINYQDILKELHIEKEDDIEKLNETELKTLAIAKVEITRKERNYPIRFYEPTNEKTKEFHKRGEKIRFIIGGNRSGKTEALIVESLWLALGIHPYKKVRVPNSGWIVSLDFPTNRDVIEPKINKWLPMNEITKWDQVDKIIYLKNGSTVGFKSCDSGFKKFQGPQRDWIGLDEEQDYLVYQECIMRTIDSGGLIFCAMTPTNGMSWTYDLIYEMAGIDPDIWCTTMEIYENKYLEKIEIKRIEKMISEEEKDMRLKGQYIQFSGLIYKNFKKEYNVIPDSPKWFKDNECFKFLAIDPGIDNPTACIWIAMNKDIKIPEYHIYDDYYEIDKTIEENVRNIVGISGNDKIMFGVLDPWAGSQRNNATGLTTFDEYRKSFMKFSNGRIMLKRIDRYDKIAQINKIRELLRLNDILNKISLTIRDHCYATVKEFCRYRYQTQRDKSDKNLSEKPQKVLDHTMNCLESFFSVNPRPEIFLDDEYVEPEQKKWYK